MAALVVWGASGHGRVVAEVGQRAGFTVAYFVDDSPARVGTVVDGRPVLAVAEGIARARIDGCAVALGVGDNRARARVLAAAIDDHLTCPPLVHPTAVVSATATLGDGTVVGPLAIVNPGARVGRGVIINSAAVVEHDCIIADFCHISPGAVLTGAARLGRSVHVGAGAVVLVGRTVGDEAVVGAGAVVTRDVPRGATVAGIPARTKEEHV